MSLLLAVVPIHAALIVTNTPQTITIRSDHYAVTFDKTKGGAITHLGDHPVVQNDHANQYKFVGTAKISESPNAAVVTVNGFYVDGKGNKALSRLRAEYQYIFHGDSPVVFCQVQLRQDQITAHADMPMLPSWPSVWRIQFRSATPGSKEATSRVSR